jgi:two-component system cell cycle response regulator CtrA
VRLLTISSDRQLAAAIERSVVGRATSHHEQGAVDAIRLALDDEFDAVVVDRALPGKSGLDIVRAIRAKGAAIPILLLLDDSNAAGRIAAFLAGVDDVMPKSFDSMELLVRLERLVRRCHGHSTPGVAVGAMLVDYEQRVVSINGQPADLTAKEFDVIGLLALRPGKVLSKQYFLNQLYGGLDEPEGKIIHVFICKLRKKLAALGGGDVIATVRGQGYVLRPPDPGFSRHAVEPRAREMEERGAAI